VSFSYNSRSGHFSTTTCARRRLCAAVDGIHFYMYELLLLSLLLQLLLLRGPLLHVHARGAGRRFLRLGVAHLEWLLRDARGVRAARRR
jgi:hypothetical protein